MVAGMDRLRAQLARTSGVAAVFAATLLGASCDLPPAHEPGQARPPGYVVDSILPPVEALRRFRAGVERVTVLDGPSNRAELLRRVRYAITRNDTAALRALAVNRAEFAYLIYPESRLSRPPFRQPPEIAWMMLQQASAGGLRKLLSRSPTMTLLGVTCPDSVQVEGAMRTISGCTVRVQTPDNVRDVRLFGRIVELGGRWKVVGYDGDL